MGSRISGGHRLFPAPRTLRSFVALGDSARLDPFAGEQIATAGRDSVPDTAGILLGVGRIK